MSTLKELKVMFCPPLDFALVEDMYNDRTDDDACMAALLMLADSAEHNKAETDNDSATSDETGHVFVTRRNGKAIANNDVIVEVNPPTVHVTLNGNELFIENNFDRLSAANSSVENLEVDIHRLGISEGSDSGCSMSTTSEETAPDEETERLETSKEEGYDELELLKECFPDIGPEKLKKLLRNYSVEEALEILLDPEIDQRETDLPAITPTPLKERDRVNAVTLEPRAQHRKMQRRRQNGRRQNERQRRASQRNANAYESSSTRSTSPASLPSSSSPLVFPPPAHDRLQCLKKIFPKIPAETVSRVFHANHYNVLESAQKLYDDVPSAKQEPSDEDLAVLCAHFYEYDVDELRKILVITRGDLEKATDLMFLIIDDTKNSPRTWSQVVRSSTSPSKYPEIGEYSAVDNNRLSVGEGDRRRNASSSKVISASPAYDRDKTRSFRTYDDDEEEKQHYCDDVDNDNDNGRINDPVYCRKKAKECRDKRDKIFRHAADVYKKTRFHKRNEVHGYSDQGREYDAEMKLWLLRAARAQVRQKSKAKGDPNFVDLHGLTVNEALAVVKEELERWSSSASNKKPLEIVTGAGNHSYNNVPRLWIDVGEHLENTNWIFKKERGHFLVRGRKGSS